MRHGSMLDGSAPQDPLLSPLPTFYEADLVLSWRSTALMGDPKYRKFAQAVDKTLQSFDQVNEWADFITFLAKLLKVSLSVIRQRVNAPDERHDCLSGFSASKDTLSIPSFRTNSSLRSDCHNA
jgi:hypothetical protein